MVVEGVDVKTAQARLGHSDPRLTLAIYAQATTEGDRSAAVKLGARVMGNQRRGISSKAGESRPRYRIAQGLKVTDVSIAQFLDA